jgi:Tol biopolymer transport system component/tRNA A-37 threonylcarbamoyl transferase component Bud32
MLLDDFEQIEKIFQQALLLPTDQRAQFLAEACGANDHLRQKVERLLGAHSQAGSFLQRPPAGPESDSDAASRNFAGKKLGHYQVISPLGKGGMGEVWLADDTRLMRKVALKFLPADMLNNRDRMRRFEQEARTASALNHPNIITIHEIGEAAIDAGPLRYIVTEYIDGQTLRQRLSRSPIPLPEALAITSQIASALAAAHEAGVVHRDIKPENVMLRRDGIIKVLDFGLAKANFSQPLSVDSEAPTMAKMETEPGAVVGTARYMSPEQARGEKLDTRTDIFSLGVLLYELLTGKPPFDGVNIIDVLAAILDREPPPLVSLAPATPPDLDRLVAKAMRKDREQRYQSVKDLLIDLNDVRESLSVSAKVGSAKVGSAKVGSAKAGRATGETKAAATVEVPPAETVVLRRSTLRRLAVIAPIVLLIGAVVLWWRLAADRGEMASTSPLKSVEVSAWASEPGEIYTLGAFSSDGKWVAYSGNRNIWVKQTTMGRANQTTQDKFDNDWPIWSPKDELAYVSRRDNRAGIWRVPAMGDTPTLITELQNSEAKLRRWSKRDVIYYESENNLFAFDLNTKQTKRLTDLGALNPIDNTINISPDEQRISYITSDSEGGSAGGWSVWVKPVSGGAPTRIARANATIRNTVWRPDNQSVLYSANVDRTFQIFMAYTDGRPPAQLTEGERDSFVLDVSADGARALFGSSKEESDIWAARVDSADEIPITSDLSAELWPAVSPDGKSLAYQAVRNLSQGNKISRSELLSKSLADGGQGEQPFRLSADGFLQQWSPDGKQIAFLRRFKGSFSLWSVSGAGGAPRQLAERALPTEYTWLPYNRWQASDFSWSPDGARIAYCSDKDGRIAIRLTAVDGTGDTQIANSAAQGQEVYCPLWSADGKRLAWSSKKSAGAGKATRGVWLTDVSANTSRPVFQSESFLRLLGWSEKENELFLATQNDKEPTELTAEVRLIAVSIDSGQQRPIATLPSAYPSNIYLSWDRRVIAFTSRQDGKDNLWIIPVSGGAPRKLTANKDPRLYFSSLAWSPDGKAIYFGKQSRYSLLMMLTNLK